MLGDGAIATVVAAPVVATFLALAIGYADLLHAPVYEEVCGPSTVPEGSHVGAILEEDITIFAPDHSIPLTGWYFAVPATAALSLADVVFALSTRRADATGATAPIITTLLAGTTWHALPLAIVGELFGALRLLGYTIVKSQVAIPAAFLLFRIDERFAVQVPEHAAITPEHDVVFATAFEDDVAARPLATAFTVETLLPCSANTAASAAAIITTFKAGAVGNTLAMFEAAVSLHRWQPLAGDVLAYRLAIGNEDLAIDAGEKNIAITPAFLVKRATIVARGNTLANLRANRCLRTISAASTATVGATHFALTIWCNAVRNTLALR